MLHLTLSAWNQSSFSAYSHPSDLRLNGSSSERLSYWPFLTWLALVTLLVTLLTSWYLTQSVINLYYIYLHVYYIYAPLECHLQEIRDLILLFTSVCSAWDKALHIVQINGDALNSAVFLVLKLTRPESYAYYRLLEIDHFWERAYLPYFTRDEMRLHVAKELSLKLPTQQLYVYPWLKVLLQLYYQRKQSLIEFCWLKNICLVNVSFWWLNIMYL